MATRPDDLRLLLAEFLDWDDGTDTRYELIDGQVLAMAPPSPRDGALTAQLARLIGNGLRPPCRVIVEAGDRDAGPAEHLPAGRPRGQLPTA
jgi:Uma2 family endonuclease